MLFAQLLNTFYYQLEIIIKELSVGQKRQNQQMCKSVFLLFSSHRTVLPGNKLFLKIFNYCLLFLLHLEAIMSTLYQPSRKPYAVDFW